MNKPRIVVCAANKYGDDIVFLGARHYDMRMHQQMAEANFDKLDRRCMGEV